LENAIIDIYWATPYILWMDTRIEVDEVDKKKMDDLKKNERDA
jgi:hypothetical protein